MYEKITAESILTITKNLGLKEVGRWGAILYNAFKTKYCYGVSNGQKAFVSLFRKEANS